MEETKNLRRTFRLQLAYRGTNYHGWQKQASEKPQLTVQEVLEEAIRKIVGDVRISLHGSGRTDTGVHARCQVAHLRVKTSHTENRLLMAINSHLPEDIRVLEIKEMPGDFHAQLDVSAKTYRYFIYNTLSPTQQVHWPFLRSTSWFVTYPLDIEAMRQALQVLQGKHDFKSFQNRGTPVPSTVREILEVELVVHRFQQKDFPWYPGPEIACQLLEFRIRGTGFLKQMIRTIVGTIVEIGRGKLSADAMEEILQSQNRSASGITAPANGLFLDQVEYDLSPNRSRLKIVSDSE